MSGRGMYGLTPEQVKRAIKLLERDALLLATGLYWITWLQLRLILGAHIIGGETCRLRLLPPDILRHIAKFAHHHSRVTPRFPVITPAKITSEAEENDVSEGCIRRLVARAEDGQLQKSFVGFDRVVRLPWSMCRWQYFEFDFFVWSGTSVHIQDHVELVFELMPSEEFDEHQMAAVLKTPGRGGVLGSVQREHISAWDGLETQENHTLGLLLDYQYNAMRMSLDHIVGPAVYLKLDAIKKADMKICVFDDDPAMEQAVTDIICVPAEVPMRMVDPDLHPLGNTKKKGLLARAPLYGLCRKANCWCQHVSDEDDDDDEDDN